MLEIAWVETTRDGTKIGFLFRFCYPFSYHHWEGGAQPMIGGGGRARSDVTVVFTGVVLYRPGRAEALPMFNWALPIPL